MFVLGTCIALLPLKAQKTIKPKPDRAIVYLSGTELSYSETISLPAGTTELIVEGVAPGLDENSISAFFKGGMVVDSKKGLRYPEAPKVFDQGQKYTVHIRRISDSLDDLSWLVKDCDNKKAALQKEKYLLLNNRLMRGEFSRDSVALLKSTLDLLRQRHNSIDEEELQADRRKSKLLKISAALQERLTWYNNLQSNIISGISTEQYTPIYYIAITLQAETAVTGVLNLRYYTAEAGWVPRYDILAASGKDKIQLLHRAQVYQNTGIDWKDLSLVLSTSNPGIGNTKPLLTAWNLYFGYPNTYSETVNRKKAAAAYNYNQYKPQVQVKSLNIETTEDNAGSMPVQEPVFNMSENLLRMEYEIKTKYSIASDNKGHNVLVSSTEVPVALTYMCVPKLDRDAFLMGKLANWEDLNLLPASARIYFDESYIGLTAIEPETTKDTLYVNLGRDKSIVVKRQALKDKCREQIMSDTRVLTKTFEITIRNTKSIGLDFEVEDQIPVSSDPNIKIVLLNKDGALYDELTGKLTWKLNIKAKDSKKVQFSYEVRYPKDKHVMGL